MKMANFILSLGLYWTILVFSDGLNCTNSQYPESLKYPGTSVVYTRQLNGTLSIESIACPVNTIFSVTQLKCVQVNNGTQTKCTRSGRIADSSSSNCTTYLICTQQEDGSFVSNQVACPVGTIFSPNANRCVASNKYSCSLESDKKIAEVSAACSSNGRFPDPSSTNCSTYLICTQLNDSSYSLTRGSCPSGTVFSPYTHRCVSNLNYTCPDGNLLRTNGNCKANGRFADSNSSNCSSYLVCTKRDDGSFSSTIAACPLETVFAPSINRCVYSMSYNCSANKNESLSTIEVFECQINGRFTDPNSANCSSYISCTQLEDGNFFATKVSCPAGTLFSSNSSRCISSSRYTCSWNLNASSDSFETTNLCKQNGRYPDLESFNCSSYLSCTQLEDGSFILNRVRCPQDTLFAANVSRCVSSRSYVCPMSKETKEFKCQASGRFGDPTSTNCSSYLSCTQLEDGSFFSTQVTCPPGTLYSINSSRCVPRDNYTCHQKV